MSDALFALTGSDIFDGETLHHGQSVLVSADTLHIVAPNELPPEIAIKHLKGGALLPGFVDLQVNGGGGVMFNDNPSVETLSKIAQAHATLGTHALLATLITDTPALTEAAVKAVAQAVEEGVPGIVGLHLEGPHLAVTRKGAHAADLIRPMSTQDLNILLSAAENLPNLMVTLAPEAVTLGQITQLAKAGVIVSLGHSDAPYEDAMRAFEAGAHCTTHLFNAMSQLGGRTPGLVGATLDHNGAAGLIADGIHVHPATIRAALGAKSTPGDVFLVTDAMACAGSDIDSFTLNGRRILRREGRLTLADGTLAGADLSMTRALQVMIHDVGDAPAKALARATSIPAALLREDFGLGGWPSTLTGLNYIDVGFETVTPANQLV